MKTNARFVIGMAALLPLSLPRATYAGMPSVQLTDIAKMRVESISFFLLLLLISTWLVKLIWNSLRRDFMHLPRLTFARSLGLVVLWGFLFVLVLTMISGARELMTPGAWEPNGLTYKLASSDDAKANDEVGRVLAKRIDAQRRPKLEHLKRELWDYASKHEGAFPPSDTTADIPSSFWETPELSRVRYVYIPGRRAGVGDEVLAYEPDVFPGERYALTTSGVIRTLNPSDLQPDSVTPR